VVLVVEKCLCFVEEFVLCAQKPRFLSFTFSSADMSELVFLVTPGLSIFLSPDTATLIAASADVTMFYSVTVLLLVGHLPPMCVCGHVSHPEGSLGEQQLQNHTRKEKKRKEKKRKEKKKKKKKKSSSFLCQKDQESSVTLASLLWLVLALLSVCLLIMHIVMPLPFLFHALVVVGLVRN
jgi:hypothetical protein